MTDKELKKILSAYTVDVPEKCIENTKRAISEAEFLPTAPKFSAIKFLFGQLHNIKLPFFLTALCYMAVSIGACIWARWDFAAVIICSATPFLSVSGMTVIFFGSKKESLELEMSCLYQPKTVFAGRSVLCGTMNLLAVSLCSIICGLASGAKVNRILLLGLMCLVLSSVVTLGSFTLMKTKTAVFFSTGLFCAFGSTLILNEKGALYIREITALQSAYTLAIGAVLLLLVYFLSIKKYSFERLNKNVY